MSNFPPMERIRKAARSFVTRRVPDSALVGLLDGDMAPRPGDLVLARIERLGHHRRLELPTGRRRNMFPGDEVVLAYANRYAARQFEAIVPRGLEPCHLAAAGGIAAKAISWHSRIWRGPTSIVPLGLVAGEAGHALNVADFALPAPPTSLATRSTRIAVLGSSMDSGKTTSVAFLARGLLRAGLRVGYAKVTGTGAGGDLWMVGDAGAAPVLDFTDAGLASTYRAGSREVERVALELLAHLDAAAVDVALVEVADGPYQPETSALLESGFLAQHVDGALFAAADAMGTGAGSELLKQAGLRVLGVAGVFTASPLQQREALLAARLPVFEREQLAEPVTARKLFDEARS